MSAFRPLLGVLTVCALASAGQAQETLTYDQLVHRLTDLSQLAVLPAPGEQGAQWSSYDRASKYDEKTGKYIAWDANGDGQGIIRKEGDLSVMAEMKGPGCIWRIWSAAAEKGHVKIYLDDQEKPVVDLPFAHYFDGKHAPFNYPALSYNLGEVHSSGQNLYLPIPYQKSCKIVAQPFTGRKCFSDKSDLDLNAGFVPQRWHGTGRHGRTDCSSAAGGSGDYSRVDGQNGGDGRGTSGIAGAS